MGKTGGAASQNSYLSTRHLPDRADGMGCECYQYQSVSKQYQRLGMEEKGREAELSVWVIAVKQKLVTTFPLSVLGILFCL